MRILSVANTTPEEEAAIRREAHENFMNRERKIREEETGKTDEEQLAEEATAREEKENDG